jgi:hypothetical protein
MGEDLLIPIPGKRVTKVPIRHASSGRYISKEGNRYDSINEFPEKEYFAHILPLRATLPQHINAAGNGD